MRFGGKFGDSQKLQFALEPCGRSGVYVQLEIFRSGHALQFEAETGVGRAVYELGPEHAEVTQFKIKDDFVYVRGGGVVLPHQRDLASAARDKPGLIPKGTFDMMVDTLSARRGVQKCAQQLGVCSQHGRKSTLSLCWANCVQLCGKWPECVFEKGSGRFKVLSQRKGTRGDRARPEYFLEDYFWDKLFDDKGQHGTDRVLGLELCQKAVAFDFYPGPIFGQPLDDSAAYLLSDFSPLFEGV